MLTIFIIILYAANKNKCVFAHTSSSESALDSDGILPNNDVEHYSNVAVHAVNNTCPNTHDLETELSRSIFRIKELIAELENANANLSRCKITAVNKEEEILAYQNRLQEAKSELADAISERNASFQTSKSLQEKMERMEREHSQILNETITEIVTLNEDLERRKRQVKSTEDRYHETRKMLSELDAELRRMHKRAVSQYVNFTLMQDDAWSTIEKTVSKAGRHVERQWERQYRRLRPQLHEAKRTANKAYRDVKSSLNPKIRSLQRKVLLRWTRSKHLRPFFESSLQKLTTAVSDLFRQYEPTVNNAKEACRLSAISVVEETSKSILNYIDASIKEKEEMTKRKREQGRKRDPIRRQQELRRRYRLPFGRDDVKEEDEVANDEDSIEPSVIHVKIRAIFKYVLEHSEQLVKKATALLPLFLVLSTTQRVIIGGVLLYIGVPPAWVWFFGVFKFVRLVRMSAHEEKK